MMARRTSSETKVRAAYWLLVALFGALMIWTLHRSKLSNDARRSQMARDCYDAPIYSECRKRWYDSH